VLSVWRLLNLMTRNGNEGLNKQSGETGGVWRRGIDGLKESKIASDLNVITFDRRSFMVGKVQRITERLPSLELFLAKGPLINVCSNFRCLGRFT
jgi:hypothetical protein